jgi:hypothetical protein
MIEVDQEAAKIIEKQNQFIGFFYIAFNKYWQTLIFIIVLSVLIFGFRYIHNKLQFSENKTIANWFGILIIVNVILTYIIIIIYQQVSEQPGIPGPAGVQGPQGNMGESSLCSKCNAQIPVYEQEYDETPVKQPLLPDKIVLKSQADEKE